MSEKLDLILKELQTLNSRVTSIETKLNVIDSNQHTFLLELREQRIESQTHNRLIYKDFGEIKDAVRFVNRRIADVELDFAINSPEKNSSRSEKSEN